jgi:hypothetical protein
VTASPAGAMEGRCPFVATQAGSESECERILTNLHSNPVIPDGSRPKVEMPNEKPARKKPGRAKSFGIHARHAFILAGMIVHQATD